MQTCFITDLRAVAVPLGGPRGPDAAISLRYFDDTGRQVGTSVLTAAELAELARRMIALAEAAILHAANADGGAKPRPVHFPVMRDVRSGEAG